MEYKSNYTKAYTELNYLLNFITQSSFGLKHSIDFKMMRLLLSVFIASSAKLGKKLLYEVTTIADPSMSARIV